MENDKKKIRSIFLGIAGCIVLFWVLFQPERLKGAWDWVIALLSPFLVGSVLAFIMNVPMRAFENLLKGIKKQEVRRPLALLLTVIAVILVVTLVVVLLIPQVVDTAETVADKLPAFYSRVESTIMTFLQDNPELLEWVGNNIDLKSLDIGGILKQALDVVSGSVTTIVNSAFSAIGTFTSGLVNAEIGRAHV